MIGMRYTLTKIEQQLAEHLGKQRRKNNRALGVVDQFVETTRSAAEADIDAMGAELAFCRLFNVYPDLDVSPRAGGGDAILAGKSVDVKTTDVPFGRLLVPVGKNTTGVDLYALMVGRFPTYEFRGLQTAARVLRLDNIEQFKYGKPAHAVEQRDLVTAKDLKWSWP